LDNTASYLGCSLPATTASRPDAKAPLDKKWWPMNLSDVKGLKVCLVVKKIGYDWVCCLISFQNALLSALLAFFSCPWVDRIYCDNNFMIKIETKCRRRGISFFSVSDPNASATPQVESTRSRRGWAPSDECKSNAPSRPHNHFDSFSIIFEKFFCCWWMLKREEGWRVDGSSHRCQVATPWHQSLPPTFFSLQTLF